MSSQINESKRDSSASAMDPFKFALNAVKILVADDVPDNQLLMKHYLKGAGAQVDVACTGKEAIEKILSNDYDIVLMDIQMPVMDGIQATRSLREQGYHKPIFALTAHAMGEEVRLSLQAGCNEYLTKPVVKQTLIQTIEKYLN